MKRGNGDTNKEGKDTDGDRNTDVGGILKGPRTLNVTIKLWNVTEHISKRRNF